MLEVRNVACSLGGTRIIEEVSATFKPGEFSVIIGPNGSGKTTLLRVMSGEIRPDKGRVLYNGREIVRSDMKSLARERAMLSQSSDLSFPLMVEEVVMMGRYPHFALRPSPADERICDQAIEEMGIGHLLGRSYLTLSGGEKQMVQFARVLAQIWEPPDGRCRTLLLDEPTAFLDINHQHLFLRTARRFATGNSVVIAVIHDLLLAAQYADFIVALQGGRKVAEGTVDAVFTPALFSHLYGMEGRVIEGEGVPFPIILF